MAQERCFARGRLPLGGAGLALGLALSSCSGPVEPGEVQQLTAAIEGGYFDESTTGVVGLGIQLDGSASAGHCSGTLLAPNLVLTARHCVLMESLVTTGPLDCAVGDFMTTIPARHLLVSPTAVWPTDSRSGDFYGVSSIHLAPGANSICGYDVALLILDRPVSELTAQPIVPRVDEAVAASEVFSAAGYGLNSPTGDWAGTRNRIDDKVVLCSHAGCDGIVAVEVTESEWVSADAGVCSGDSGGPALDAAGRVIGVISRGAGDSCTGTVFADVSAWDGFIIDVAGQAATQGRYLSPFWVGGSSAQAPAVAALPAPPAADEAASGQADAGAPAPDCSDAEDCRVASAFGQEGCAVAAPSADSGAATGFAWWVLGGVAASAVRRRRLRRT